MRLNQSIVVYDGADQVASSLGRQQHCATAGSDRAAVADESFNSTLLNDQFDRATEIEQHLAASAQQSIPSVCGDAAFIENFRRNQRNHPPIGGLDVALIDDRVAAASLELVIASQEVSG